MERFAEEHGIDMAASWAYSDSASDLPMLRAVGNPVVVNPDHALLEVARAEDWRVMRFEQLGRKLAIGSHRGAGGARGDIQPGADPSPPRGAPVSQACGASAEPG